ncbi:hypothetical protein [Rhizobium mongolense]|uniref:Uncharacterized protein n=1 Tax=Rhizobium mongolense TaxID=57676 RepID=A0ABR6IY31_9HYPH|nr:hypothetical protein [Rhizobium mongolense]MBB4232802.1 hypothetical protein [Rhizobium mongolense]
MSQTFNGYWFDEFHLTNADARRTDGGLDKTMPTAAVLALLSRR